MTWIHHSLLMYFFSVVMYLVLRKLQRVGIPSEINNFFMWGFAALTFIFLALKAWKLPILDWYWVLFVIITSYFCSFLGQRLSLEAIKNAPNSGYSLMIQKSYAIYTVIASVFLFDSELTLKNILVILLVLVFMTLLVSSDGKQAKADPKWVRDSFLAFFAFGTLALTTKWMLNFGVDPIVRSFYVMCTLSVMFTIDLFRRPQAKTDWKKFLNMKKFYPWYILMGVTTGLFNLFMQYAYEITPNIGYVNIFNTASIAAITLLSALIFKEELTLRKFIGVLGVTLGVVLLVV